MYQPIYDVPDRDSRMWAMIIHLSGLTMLTGLYFVHIFVPLIIWLAKRDEHPFIDQNGRNALNFQISWTIYFVVMLTACIVLSLIIIGFVLIPVVIAIPFVQAGFALYGGIKANDGEVYRYPLSLPFF